jgi:hypothetical protein
MLVKSVHKFFPANMFEGFIATESIESNFADIRTVNKINAMTLTTIKVVFRLTKLKKFLFLLGLT